MPSILLRPRGRSCDALVTAGCDAVQGFPSREESCPMPPPPRALAKLPSVTTTASVTAPAVAPTALKERPPQRKPAQLPPSNAAALAALRAGDKKPLVDPSQKDSQDKV